MIEQVRPIIFNFDYPIFDEDYRKPLETKIIRHFYNREICTTPWSEWQLFLEDKMNVIMPYFNQLYKSETLAFNPLITVDYGRKFTRNAGTKEDSERTETQDRNSTGSSTNHTTENGSTNQTIDSSNNADMNENTTTKKSDTPQNNLYGVTDNLYLSELEMRDTTTSTKDSGSSTSNATSQNTSDENSASTTIDKNNVTENKTNNASTTEDYIESITGKNTGESYAKLLMEFRESFLNIDAMILNELNPLFFGLY